MSQVTNISIAIWPEGVGSLWEDDFIAALARMGVSGPGPNQRRGNAWESINHSSKRRSAP